MICDGDDVDPSSSAKKEQGQALLEKLCRPCLPQKIRFDLD